MSETVVLCEGYHDRAFWDGWLSYLGCRDPGAPKPGSTKRSDIFDPWKTKVVGGQHAYLSKTGKFLRVVPCDGRGNILREARIRLIDRSSKRLMRLVFNMDADTSAAGTATGPSGLRKQDVLYQVQQIDPSAAENADGEIEVDAGATKVSLVRWEASDPAGPGLPDEQTLERLVCAAVIAAYPPRAKAVQNWLASRPQPPAASPKEHAWSHMAGWYAEYGCDAFHANIWHDPSIASELESRLRVTGAWTISEKLAG